MGESIVREWGRTEHGQGDVRSWLLIRPVIVFFRESSLFRKATLIVCSSGRLAYNAALFDDAALIRRRVCVH